MTYIIAEPCVGIKDAACVDVCPVDCIYSEDDDNMFYINPEECIDCAACEPVCPVVAIFAEDDSKEKMTENQDDEFKQDYKLKTGHFYYTDVRKAHAVENLSDTDRIHLVMDCYVNNEMRYMIC